MKTILLSKFQAANVDHDVSFPRRLCTVLCNSAVLLLPRDAMLARYMLYVCLSATTRWIWLVLAWELPLTYPKLCYKETRVPPKIRLSSL